MATCCRGGKRSCVASHHTFSNSPSSLRTSYPNPPTMMTMPMLHYYGFCNGFDVGQQAPCWGPLDLRHFVDASHWSPDSFAQSRHVHGAHVLMHSHGQDMLASGPMTHARLAAHQASWHLVPSWHPVPALSWFDCTLFPGASRSASSIGKFFSNFFSKINLGGSTAKHFF